MIGKRYIILIAIAMAISCSNSPQIFYGEDRCGWWPIERVEINEEGDHSIRISQNVTVDDFTTTYFFESSSYKIQNDITVEWSLSDCKIYYYDENQHKVFSNDKPPVILPFSFSIIGNTSQDTVVIQYFHPWGASKSDKCKLVKKEIR